MKLDELKKNMSTLDQVLAKTNSDIKINVSASETAQAKILKKFRQIMTSCAILAVVFTAMIIGGISPHKFSIHLKICLVAYSLVCTIWYAYLYFKLKNINIAVLSPAQLFSKTANIRILMISGEIFFGIVIGLLLIYALYSNPTALWALAYSFVVWIVVSVFHYWPQYIKLFSDLNSIKE